MVIHPTSPPPSPVTPSAHGTASPTREPPYKVGILLPYRSPGHNPSQHHVIESLQSFIDTNVNNMGSRFQPHVYVGIDSDDPVMANAGWETQHWEQCFQTAKSRYTKWDFKIYPAQSPPIICDIARDLSRIAYKDQCDFFVLLGDDTRISTSANAGAHAEAHADGRGWMDFVLATFEDIRGERSLPFGFGCVALRDTAFIGFPTFPVVHRTHLQAHGGQLYQGSAFVNQDMDPWLYAIYRRWGASRFCDDVLIENGHGGCHEARYNKVHTHQWTQALLSQGVDTSARWLEEHQPPGSVHAAQYLTMDVVVPSYRVQEEYLTRICDLQVPTDCDVQVIIIIDNPEYDGSPIVARLEESFRERVRIRCLSANMGASAARNRGLDEATGQWVVFIDDDVIPSPSILSGYAQAIRAHPEAAGFVGVTTFPPTTTTLSRAIELADLTHFWDVADRCDHPPWGVTANLASRRGATRFDLAFPKTGGGEDIDYVYRVAAEFQSTLYAAPRAHAQHPWWDEGYPDPRRFWGWARGDSRLMTLYPQYKYLSWPNSQELTVLLLLLYSFSLVSLPHTMTLLIALWLGDLCAYMSYLWSPQGGKVGAKSRIPAGTFDIAGVLAWLYVSVVEWSHLLCPLFRGTFSHLSHRYDWWSGRNSEAIPNERARHLSRLLWQGTWYFILLVLWLPVGYWW